MSVVNLYVLLNSKSYLFNVEGIPGVGNTMGYINKLFRTGIQNIKDQKGAFSV